MTTAAAPAAPGRLGVALESAELLSYLGELLRWLDERREELDRLDEAARGTDNPQAYTGDVVLALTLWQAIRTRTDQLQEVWDSGRADAVARERMSQLIWGRLDSGSGAELVSLVEASTLCDAVVSQLRSRLAFDPQAADQVARLRGLRAGLVRCEDLAGNARETAALVGELRERLAQLTAQASRGGDITGPLTELEAETARTERDLIVAAARRRELARDRERAAEERDRLAAREPALHALAQRCRTEITPHPKLAVPEISRLGDVPQDAADLAQFLTRLDAVRRAQETVEAAYASPLRERAELRYRLTQLKTITQANGRDASATVRSGYDEALAAVTASPCSVSLTRFLVDQYEYLSREAPQEGTAP